VGDLVQPSAAVDNIRLQLSRMRIALVASLGPPSRTDKPCRLL
jgi:hypothetical protein